MAHRETQFPTGVSYGMIGGPKFSTLVVLLTSGFERRKITWSDTKGEWNLGHRLKTQTEIDALLAFFYVMEGMGHSFRFKDWVEFVLARQNIGTTDGSDATYQIFKRYTAGVDTYDKDLKKIVAATALVWVNDVSIAEGAGASQFQLNDDTGIVTLGSTLAAQSGTAVEVACEYDKPVRMAIDHAQISIEFFNTFNWELTLEEIRIV